MMARVAIALPLLERSKRLALFATNPAHPSHPQ